MLGRDETDRIIELFKQYLLNEEGESEESTQASMIYFTAILYFCYQMEIPYYHKNFPKLLRAAANAMDVYIEQCIKKAKDGN